MKQITAALMMLIFSLTQAFATTGNVYIENSVSEEDYSFSVEYQNDENRDAVTDGYSVPKVLSLIQSDSPSITNSFYIVKSKGNKKNPFYVTITVEPGYFIEKDTSVDSGVYPEAILNINAPGTTNAYSYEENMTYGLNDNGISFKYLIDSGIYSNPEDIGSFYISYDSKDFESVNVVAGSYQSTIAISITDEN